jgi:hypothetical protein
MGALSRMNMGRERPIVRWEVRSQLLAQEIEAITAKLAAADEPGSTLTASERADLRRKLEALRARQRQMGPSPHARMG